MLLRVALVLLVVLAILAGITTWLGLRLVDPLGLTGWARALGWFAAVSPLLLFPLTMIVERARVADWLHHTHGPGFVLLGLFSYVFALMVLREVVWVGGSLAGWIPDDPGGRGTWLAASSLAVLGLAVVLTAAGMVQALRPPALVRVRIPVEDLHPDLEGLRIAQITDVHLGAFTGAGFLSRVIERVNAEAPDLVAVTGDLGEGHADLMGHLADPLRDIEAPAYFCPGNHEEIWGEAAWNEVVAERGVAVLKESWSVVEVGEARLLVAGVSDHTGMRASRNHTSDPGLAREGAPDVDLALLLAHQPASAYEAARAGYDVQLSGHTHGGQYVPWSWMIGLFQPFAVGLHRHEGLWIYTSVGARFWGPPLRLGTRTEIAIIELVGA